MCLSCFAAQESEYSWGSQVSVPSNLSFLARPVDLRCNEGSALGYTADMFHALWWNSSCCDRVCDALLFGSVCSGLVTMMFPPLWGAGVSTWSIVSSGIASGVLAREVAKVAKVARVAKGGYVVFFSTHFDGQK